MSLRKNASDALGDLFIIGFNGLELSPETSAFLTEARIGGVILFSRNYENPGQLSELCNQVQENRTGLPRWIGTDQEGGKVQRFKKGFSRIPDAASIGAMGSPQLAFEVSEVIAKELRAVGVNLNFCPVADIATNSKNPVIANRAFGTTAEDVSKMVTAFVRGHLVQGVQACVKHFPGHGDTSTDSHFALPSVDASLDTLLEREFKPFLKAFKSHCSMVMTAHIMLPNIDPEYPATLSPSILQGILREKLQYDRVVISDDMEMKAITDHFGADEAAILALKAGCDLLTYRSENAARIAYESIQKAIEKGHLMPEVVLAAQKRILDLKKKVLLPYKAVTISEVGKNLNTSEYQQILGKIEDQSQKR